MLVVMKFIGNVGGNIQHRATDGETKTGDGGQKEAEAKGSTLIEQHLISTLDINRVDEKQFKAVAECADDGVCITGFTMVRRRSGGVEMLEMWKAAQ